MEVKLDESNEKLEISLFSKIFQKLKKSFITLALIKLILALLISLTINDWWSYGRNDDSLVESCSSTIVTNCNSYCNEIIIVDVNITDDDFTVDVDAFPPKIISQSHYGLVSYCIAQLPGHCAYDYWVVFKFVPFTLHVLQFVLQCAFWFVALEFAPQQRQFDLIIDTLYSDISKDTTGSGSGTGTARPWLLGCDWSWVECRVELIKDLEIPELYSIFAFIEIFTVIYVWGELQYPAVYCGNVRPLSLYYYPILMSLLDMIKLNMYMFSTQLKKKQLLSALFALFNVEIFITNTWVTFVLSLMYIWHIVGTCYGYVTILFMICIPISNNNSKNSKNMDNVIENPIHIHNAGAEDGDEDDGSDDGIRLTDSNI